MSRVAAPSKAVRTMRKSTKSKNTIGRSPHNSVCLAEDKNCSHWASRLRHVPSETVVCDFHATAGLMKKLHWGYRDLDIIDLKSPPIPLSQGYGEFLTLCRGCERPMSKRENEDALH